MPKFLDVTNTEAARAALGAPFVGAVTEVKIAAYTAEVGDVVPCDASAGGFTVYLPEAPADGSNVTVKKLDSSSNAVLVQRSGTDTFNVADTGPSVLQLVLPSQTAFLRYSAGVWYVIGNSYGPSALEALYTPRNVDALYDALGQKIVEFSQTPGATGSISTNYPPVVTALKVTNHPNSTNRVDLEVVSSGVNAQGPLRLIPKGNAGSVEIFGTFPSITAASSGSDASLFVYPKGTGSVFVGPNTGGTRPNTLEFRPGAAGGDPRIFAAGASDTNVGLTLVTKNAGTLKMQRGSNSATEVADVSTAQEFSNKTMSGASNTFSAIPQSAVTNLTTDLAGKEPTIASGTSAQYWRGDKSWQTLDKAAVGLGNVDNTSDANKPVSTATQTALDNKANAANAALTGTARVAQSGAIHIHNTSDQTTNYERLSISFQSNFAVIAPEFGGTGLFRAVRLAAPATAGTSTYSRYFQVAASAPFLSSEYGTRSDATTPMIALGTAANSGLNASSGTQNAVSIASTINQSGTAGYNALLIDLTQTATGSGTKNLINAQVGGTSQFTVNTAGTVSISGTTATVRAGTGSPESVVAAAVGSIYLQTDGGTGSTLWVKEGGGAGNTGWAAK